MIKVYFFCIFNVIILSLGVDNVWSKTQNKHIKIVRCALEKIKEMKIQGQDVFDLLKEDCKKEISGISKNRNYQDLYLNSA